MWFTQSVGKGCGRQRRHGHPSQRTVWAPAQCRRNQGWGLIARNSHLFHRSFRRWSTCCHDAGMHVRLGCVVSISGKPHLDRERGRRHTRLLWVAPAPSLTVRLLTMTVGASDFERRRCENSLDNARMHQQRGPSVSGLRDGFDVGLMSIATVTVPCSEHYCWPGCCGGDSNDRIVTHVRTHSCYRLATND